MATSPAAPRRNKRVLKPSHSSKPKRTFPMRKFYAGATVALALMLGACAPGSFGAKVEGIYSAFTGATVSPAAIIISANAYDALEVTAKNYVNPQLNKRCDGSNGPLCRDPN